MENIINDAIFFIQDNVQYAPYIICGLLLLAGFNIPVSEDLMILVSALLAYEHPKYLVKIYLGLFAGVYFSDIISYSLGRFLGQNLWKVKFFSNMVSKERVAYLRGHLIKHASITFIVARFIPFGVRNALFLTSGIIRLPLRTFVSVDFVACVISVSTYFYLYHRFGEDIVRAVKKGSTYFAIAVALLLLGLLLKKYWGFWRKWKKNPS